ncbi:DNA starvation/stationary phase protection protein [Wohlfahrtiimonas chitiniclastica]|uniref:Dps family protein n=1 Tax=Wohlfahrtiimonas chitiniclastica TaxID=400946 RepID=UPI0007B3FD3F|nr:DNA starvation/stationary phase protection protein [Wohlfahrtiimonas chitiniclastica]WHR55119.1 DNA starvation/stationary phase protection protein [Wohlfahrtiimonas chitiniclastica]
MPAKIKEIRKSALLTPTDIDAKGAAEIAGGMNALLADIFTLYMKTKNFHWHVSGPHFRDYHLLLDEQATELLTMVDDCAERVRKLGHTTLRSIGEIAAKSRLAENTADYVEAADMLAELVEDNKQLVRELRVVHTVCDEYDDFATTSLLDEWIDQAERRTWFLYESSRGAGTAGH